MTPEKRNPENLLGFMTMCQEQTVSGSADKRGPEQISKIDLGREYDKASGDISKLNTSAVKSKELGLCSRTVLSFCPRLELGELVHDQHV